MTSLDVVWYDGRDSRARPARLSFEDGQLNVESEGRVLAFGPGSARLLPRLGSTARRIELDGEGHVECADSPVLEHWLPRTSRVEAMAHWLEQRRGPALLAAAGTLLGVVAFLKLGLPWAASFAAPRIPPVVERSMTRQVLGLLDRVEMSPSTLPVARQAALRTQFRQLVDGLERQGDMKLEFRHSPRLGPNAFALPDGTVVITDELVALAGNDDEIIAVLAHEAGHHEHRHVLRQTLESSGIVVLAAVLFGDVSGSSLTVSIPAVLLESGYSRGHEDEADAFALRLLLRTQRSPQAFADIMRRLQKKLGVQDGVAYFSTHPPTEERIRRAEAAARGRR